MVGQIQGEIFPQFRDKGKGKRERRFPADVRETNGLRLKSIQETTQESSIQQKRNFRYCSGYAENPLSSKR